MQTTTLISEEDLSNLLKADLSAGLERLEQDHRDRIVGYVCKVTFGLLQSADLCDVWQDTLLDLLVKFNDASSRPFLLRYPLGWACRIAGRRAIDELRKQSRRPANEPDGGLDSLPDTSIGGNPYVEYECCELREILFDIICSLPEEDERVVALAFVISSDEHRPRYVYEPTTDAVNEIRSSTGQPDMDETRVKGLWRAINRPIRRRLKRKGYEL